MTGQKRGQQQHVTPPLRILVVDDHGQSACAVARLFRHVGHEALTACSARDAMAQARAERIDVLVSDISLPDFDGCELLRRLRALYGAEVPAIAVTGCDDAKTLQECRDAGYARFLLKPVVFEELLAALSQVCPRAAWSLGGGVQDFEPAPASAAPVASPIPPAASTPGVADGQTTAASAPGSM